MDFLEDDIPLLNKGDFRTLARTISLIENEVEGYEELLMKLKPSSAKIIGITGAPGAGKSSLTDALIGEMIRDKKKVGVLCIDPSSPFNKGALLGDRIRMSEWYNHPDVFIRSLSSKGSLGGLHPKIIEISDVMKSAGFDFIIIETVGVGQSEVDIAALADITIVMLVPEGGDIIQTMKAGLMEVADIFVINKYDRPGADSFYNNLKQMLGPVFNKTDRKTPVLKTIASAKEGIAELYKKISQWDFENDNEQKINLTTEKVWALIQNYEMKKFDKDQIKKQILKEILNPDFNLYVFAKKITGSDRAG
ncbi:MAG: methylmalonyl Co-A mutase-associated GTPase MeaB [Bacteroidota bacterium]|nr:methylmalonyl Co-A mutase-associated GTPase MeaB [Bacteroidota bacterium]